MKFRSVLLLAGLLTIFSSAFGQKNGIYSINAFSQKSIAGTIRADDNGHPVGSAVTKRYILYIETAVRNYPGFESVTVKGKTFSVQSSSVNGGKATAGRERVSRKNTVVKAAAGRLLWQVEATDDDSENNPSSLTLKGKWKGKPFSYTVKNIKELETINYQ